MVRFGTVGTGSIVREFISNASLFSEFKLEAVYSRDTQRAAGFAGETNAKKYYSDLDKLAGDADIDAVYIASPISSHCDQALKMLNAGKHVLCEKTIASTLRELIKMKKAAEDNNVVLMEAMRLSYEPGLTAIRDNITKLGKIRRVSAVYCQYSSRYDAFKRGKIKNAFNPLLSNSALTDLGVYCIHFLLELFGRPERILSDSIFLENGFEGEGALLAVYDGMLAGAAYSKISNAYRVTAIEGEDGSMTVDRLDKPHQIVIKYNDKSEEIVNIPGYRPERLYGEIDKFMGLVKRGRYDDFVLKNSFTALELMDEIREKNGIVFPADFNA